jgi:F-type H+-transporting ATPase subunit delta
MAAVAQLYARAFADVATEAKIDLKAALQQLAAFGNAYAVSHDLRELLSNPSLPLEQKLKVLDAICGRLKTLKQVRNFLAVLIQRDRMGELHEILAETRIEVDERSGMIEAEIVTARELDPVQRKQIEAGVARMAGQTAEHSRVRATYSVDPSLLGGARVRVGSTVFDGTVTGQLMRMKEQLSAV